MLFTIKFVSYCKGPLLLFFFDYKKKHRFLLYSVCVLQKKEVEFLSLCIRYFLISHLTLSIVCMCVYFTIYVVSFSSEKKKKKHILSYNDCFVYDFNLSVLCLIDIMQLFE